MDNPIDPTVPVTPAPASGPGPVTPVTTGPPVMTSSPVVQPAPVTSEPLNPVVLTVSGNDPTSSNSVPAPVPAQTPPAPLGSSSRKEAGPVGEVKPMEQRGQPNWAEADKVAKEENDQYWEAFAAEIEGEKKVLEAGGMEKIEKGEAVISPELAKEMGIKPVAPVQPTNDKSAFSIRGVSFSDGQISAGMKAPTASGVRWLVEWFVLQLMKAHFHIKKSWGGFVERSL